MFSLGTNCAQAVRRWGQKSVGKRPHFPHFFAPGPWFAPAVRENSLTFTTQPSFTSQAFPRQILPTEQRETIHFYTLSTLPITTMTIYI